MVTNAYYAPCVVVIIVYVHSQCARTYFRTRQRLLFVFRVLVHTIHIDIMYSVVFLTIAIGPSKYLNIYSLLTASIAADVVLYRSRWNII